jgi:hypothetical protein
LPYSFLTNQNWAGIVFPRNDPPVKNLYFQDLLKYQAQT